MDNTRKPGRSGPPRGKHRKPAEPRRAEPREETAEGERVAKRLARAGVASRREAETMIAAGRISVNGRVIDSPALNVLRTDRVEIDGKPIPEVERTRLFLFHKPAGYVTTNRDPEGRPTVFDILPEGLPRLMTIGRLDMNTEGLLLLTNDGGLSRVLELPSTGWLRRYRVRVHGEVDEAKLAGLSQGIAVDGVYYGAIDATLDRRQGTNAWLTLGLREGKNREVRNVLGALGLEVNRLIRISYGPFQLAELPEGAVQELKGRMLRDQLGARLIEEAGADFEAPIANAFPNAPVVADRRPRDAEPPRRQPAEPGEGGLIKRRRMGPQEKRDAALKRMDTKLRGPAVRGKREERDAPPAAQGRRNVNVWMAPGARPLGPKPRREQPDDAERSERPRPPREGADQRPRRPRDADAQGRPERPARKTYRPGKAERDGREYQPKNAGGEARPEGAARPKRTFTERPPREGRPDKPFRPRPEGAGERPARSERPRPPRDVDAGGDRPKRAFAERPPREGRPDTPFRPRPEGARERPARSDRPRPPRDADAGGDRPKRPFGDRPPREGRADKPFRPRPEGARADEGPRPQGQRPGGKKPFAGRPGKDGGRPGPGGDRPGPRGPRKGGNADRRR